MSQRVIRIGELATTAKKEGLLPVSPATVWRWVKNNRFPQPFKLGERVTVWHMADVEAFIAKQGGQSQ